MSNYPNLPCRFHTKPGGCRRTDCTFAHIDTPTRHVVRASSSARPPAPPGVCAYYYDGGYCTRGSECRFRHVVKNTRHEDDVSTTADRVAALLTPAALARIQGPGTDGFFNPIPSTMSPSEALHHLRNRFLRDGYRFRLPTDVYAFTTLLSNASSGNASWDNGLLRIADVLSWAEVAVHPTSRTVLSFQRGYVPVLRYLSSEYVVKSITSKIVNSLYSLIMEHFDHFSEVVQSCIEYALTTHNSFQESPSLFDLAGTSGGQVLSCVAQVLFEYLTRFKNAVATHPYLRPLVQMLHEWTDTWVSMVSSDDSTFDDPLSQAPVEARRVLIVRLQELVERLIAIVDRKHRDLERVKQPSRDVLSLCDLTTASEGIIAALHHAYQGPGVLRDEGPRHDNDFVNIGDIQIPPTHRELTSALQPFLPANLYGAPHPLPAESMEQLLDIQFRLLREELTASLRASAQAILEDLNVRDQGKRTQLDELLKRKGGKYRGHAVGQDTVLFNVYTGAQLTNITPSQRGLSASITIDAPPGRARATQAKARGQFWESMSSKRLMQGGLIALVWQRSDGTTEVHLGTIASSLKDLTDSAKQNADRLTIRVSFFSPEVELRILQELRLPLKERKGTKLLIEATVMFESVRPFLEALRVEPESIPFSRYLVHHPPEFYQTLQISPPVYASLPGFSFQLASLFPPEAAVEDLKLVVTSPESIENAREALKRSSKLDPSQADAMVDTLTRAVSLLQGPPGTGKSYTGVELLRVLITNDVGPILMIAFTNHALDHMLRSVLDADITKKIVRLGSRSVDERIAEFSIENMENVAGRTRLSSVYSSYRWALRNVEQEIKEFMQDFFRTDVDVNDLLKYLAIACPIVDESIKNPPPWIEALHGFQEAEKDEGWHVAGRDGKASSPSTDSIYEFWLTGRDISFLHETHQAMSGNRPPPPSSPSTANTQHQTNRFSALRLDDAVTQAVHKPRVSAAGPKGRQDNDTEDSDLALSDISPEEEWLKDMLMDSEEDEPPVVPPTALPRPVAVTTSSSSQNTSTVDTSRERSGASLGPEDFADPQQFFLTFGCPEIPAVPSTARPLQELLEQEDAWQMSMQEREQLHKMWLDELHVTTQETRTMEFRRLREKHAQAAREYTESQAEIRKQLLRNVDIIGCTTTGAAKLTTLLKGIGPKILLVEEAGQVLEAHILGSLVPSIQHLILIGDPLQLRPTLNNYSLSMDHPHGRLIYKFDMSLMERLSSSGMPMSQINLQRRMRPAIADLVRMTLYPKLVDHDLVKNYPHVRGIAKDVFFLTHNHKESGGEDDFVSKYNQFEVDMIKDLVLYLLRQGPYSSEGDIVVLCAYLGQLARLREALSGEVAVVIDERDQVELDDRAAEADEPQGLAAGSAFERVKVSRRVLIRTIDNFQGEEAKIIILSLVRNAGGSEKDDAIFGHNTKGRVNIGFLKSENRTNVALSRAREGLYILGNAQNLSAKSKMWRTVLDELDKRDCLGNAFPVVCQRHPDAVQHVSKPGELPRLAPDGGCLLQCDTRLSCGHLCPYKCHSDDPRHITVSCEQRCTRLCPRGHPCTKACSVECGRCTTDVELVELPCGHTAASVKCYQLDNLADVYCAVLLTKDLPGCEHNATMRCSDDPRQIACKVICNGVMACCGRSCKAQCHQCQMLNTRNNDDQAESEDLATAVLLRTNHVAHPCQRSLFCGHLCHECTVFCREPCRQVCAHARCMNYCSTPCAPCQEPCTWRCSHYSCPLPCGAICARLPCDKHCEQILECGHRCPSVCGEDCSIQTCPTCAPEEIRSKLVDVVMQRTLAELDVDSDSLDELTITLPACGHVFTVETLDGHCALKEYYRRDERHGRWIGLEAPPSGFKQPPACPTCRAAITAPRYGRVFKRADLDILENNVASHMSQSLSAVRSKVDTFSKADTISRIKTSAPDVSFTSVDVSNKELKAQQNTLTKILRTVRTTPVALEAIDPLNRGVHSLPPDEAKAWKKLLGTLFAAYREAKSIAMTRSAHSHAWEASFSYLFQKELESITANPSKAPRNPQEHAMRHARLKVGQPPPRADKRFLVESFWASLTIRLTLAELAGEWQDASAQRLKYPPANKRVWGTYVSFLLRSCASDVELALKITQESESHRQEATTILLMLRIDLEQFRFNVKMMMQSGKTSRESKNTLADSANAKLSEAAARVDAVRHRATMRHRTGGARTAEWLQAEFTQPAEAILEEWRSLEISLRRDTFYEPVSLEELTQVVKAFRTEFTDRSRPSLAHTGHFYKCPNGHTFVIGDCGGAVERSYCPECGAAIGGTGHSLIANNSRATDLEDILREEGVEESPWSWARF
ncbi:P-loop containing nucleoside triphosphate hydrolase protein [Cubamyces sp. BRFM 1775]|nr:P-loop containing nucleoside triphosphate hydrolase protein [Cubamyces sp. BRFM 1775]